jgi:NifB/MoaA-like Fe-S oxidoreductase
VALTEYSKHQLVREPTREECRAALAVVGDVAARAVVERGNPWCFGADELYLRAGEPLPPAAWYGEFDQRENGVGAVRYLQSRIEAAEHRLGEGDLRGKRIAVITGAAMGALMPQVMTPLREVTGAQLEVVTVANTLFGPSVTTAGLLPGAAVLAALVERRDLDLALLPAEAVNDDLLFMDDMSADDLADRSPVPVRLSYDFVDALTVGPSGRRTVGQKVPAW